MGKDMIISGKKGYRRHVAMLTVFAMLLSMVPIVPVFAVAPPNPNTLTVEVIENNEGLRLAWMFGTAASSYTVKVATSTVEVEDPSTLTYTEETTTALATYDDTTPASNNNVWYYYQVTTQYVGQTNIAGGIIDTQAPTVPSEVGATNNRNDLVVVNWTSSEDTGGVAGYVVQRSEVDTDTDVLYSTVETVTVAQAPGQSTVYKYNDTGAPANINLYYRVIAVDKAGNKSSPAPRVLGFRDSNAPTVPGEFTASPSKDDTISLSWGASDDSSTGFGYQLQYDVQRSTDGVSWSQIATNTATSATSYADQGVSENVLYSYRVRARDAAGNPSAWVSVNSIVDTYAQAPTGVTATAKPHNGTVVVDWESASDTGSGVAYYRVYRTNNVTDPESWSYEGTSSAESYVDTITAGDQGQIWYYAVTTVDKAEWANESGRSDPAAVYMPDATGPDAPTNLAVTVDETAKVTATWSLQFGIAGYILEKNTTDTATGWTEVAITLTPSYSYTPAPEEQGQTWYYRVRSFDGLNNVSEPSNVVGKAVPDVTDPSKPALTVTSGTTKISLSWSPSTDNVDGSAVTYVIESSTDTAMGTILKSIETTATTYDDTSAATNVELFYRVTAKDKASNESASDIGSGWIDTVKPTSVSNITATVSGDKVTVEWSAATDTETGVAGYVVQRATEDTDSAYATIATVSEENLKLTDVIAPADQGKTYFYRVQAIDEVGNGSDFAKAQPVFAPDVTAPSIPSGLAAVTTVTTIKISWTASTDNLPGAVNYVVERSGDGGSSWGAITTTTETSYTDVLTLVAQGKTFQYRVKAVDAASNSSAYSTVVSASPTVLPANDVNADGKSDGLIFRNDGNGSTSIWTFKTGADGKQTAEKWWTSGPKAFDLSNAKTVYGDFNGDGSVDAAALYNYGAATSGLWVFKGVGSGSANATRPFFSTTWSWKATKLVVADVDGDGKDEIVAFYNYGEGKTGVWVLSFNENGSVSLMRAGTLGRWDWTHTTLVAGKASGGAADQIVAIYDYGLGKTGIWKLSFTGKSLSSIVLANSISSFNANNAKFIMSDPNGDGKDDLIAFYSYGGGKTGVFVLSSTGSGFNAPSKNLFLDRWDSTNTTIIAGDFDGDGYGDVMAVYDYGNGTLSTWVFKSNHMALTKPTITGFAK